MLNYLIININCGVPFTTDVANVYRICKSFVYDGGHLDQFRHELVQQLQALDVKFRIVDSGTHNAPMVAYRGARCLRQSSHYWIDVTPD